MRTARNLKARLAVLLFVLSAATLASAQGPHDAGAAPRPGGPGGRASPLAMLLLDSQVYGALGLTVGQQALWTALQTAAQAAREKHDAGRATLDALVSSEFATGAPDLLAIEQAMVEQIQTMASTAAALSAQAVTLYSSLNTGQEAIVVTAALARYPLAPRH